MSDRFPGEIMIGGKLPAKLLEAFLGVVSSSGAKVGGYEGAPFDATSADGLLEVLDENRHLFLVDDEARYGQFEKLEAFCVQHGIPFDRHSSARYEFDAEKVMFRPGMKRPLEVPSNDDGDVLLNVETIRPVAKEVARLATAKMTADRLLAAVAKVSKRLNSLLPPDIKPLPPLEIVE
jgi:hypothetical protein